MTRRPWHRWLHRLAAGAVGVLVVALAPYAWAWSSLDRSTTAPALVWSEADIGDQHRFPSRLISAGEDAGPLPAGSEIDYWETDLPWADDTFTYDGVDLRNVALDRTRVERPPGPAWHYNMTWEIG